MITLLHGFSTMNDLYAIVPASAIILIIAIRKILAPIQFNEEIFGEIHPDEVNKRSMRMMIGAGFGGIGLMGLMLGFMLEAGEATTSLLYALAVPLMHSCWRHSCLQIRKDICMRFRNHLWSFSRSC